MALTRAHSPSAAPPLPPAPPRLPPILPQRVHLEYAQFLAERGELLKAMHAAMKARENCADPSQSAAVVASLVEWACLLKEWNWVSGNLSRAEFSGHLTAG